MAAVGHRDAGAQRIYRRCLGLYPAEFREEYGRELCLAFVDRRRAERSRSGVARLWVEAILGIFQEAPKEHVNMILQDIRYAVRMMRKDAAMTAIALAILALGIGAATLVFSLANGLLLRPLPYADPDRIVAMEEYSPTDPNEYAQVSLANLADIAARSHLVRDIGVYSSTAAILRGEGEAETVVATIVSDGALRALGVAPLLGHIFTREESAPHGPRVLILSEELWARRYARDPQIVGKSIAMGASNWMVVGVMPASFHFPVRAELWVPLQDDPASSPRTDYGFSGVARLTPGATAEQATAEMASLLEQIHREHPEANNHWRARVTLLRTFEAQDFRKQVIALLVAVGLLLLIACANVSNLLLVKASARRREMAVRTAMGASRRRLVRQLVTESLLLGCFGGLLGSVLAYLGIAPLVSMIPIELPRWMNFAPDERVLLAALGMTLLTSLAFGLAPAFGSSGIDLTRSLKEGGRGASGGGHKLLRNGLVTAEVALSVILLAAAGLTARSFLALRSQDLGYQPEHVLSLQISYPPRRYPDGPVKRAMIRDLTAQIAALPGVTSAAFSTGVPLNDGWSRIYTIEGRPRDLKDMPFANHVVVAPGYFRTLGIRLLDGREFVDSDYDSPQVLIVTRAFARENWPHESAVGKRVRFGPPSANEPWHTIVGVVADNKHEELKTGGRPAVYLPYNPGITPHSILVRASGDAAGIVSAVRARIRQFDRDIALSHVFTMPQLIERASWQDRFLATLFTGFALLALTLAAAGLYAALSYAVSLNTREIGIRMALGASGASVQRMWLRQGIALAGAGLVIGMGGAFALTRLLRSQLFEVSPLDPATYAVTPLVLMAVAALAAFLPARRATRVDPVIALRCD